MAATSYKLLRALQAAGLFLLALAAFAAPTSASAGASAWSENDQGRLRLLAAVESLGGAEELSLGLHFQMAEGWKIYWRSPGDAGYPPEIDWQGSENLAEASLSWPIPERFELFGLQTFGYGGDVVLPITARVEDPNRPARLQAEVDYLTCETICIPHSERLLLEIPPGAGGSSPQAHDIARFRSLVPGDGAASGLVLEDVALVEDGERPVVELRLEARAALQAPDVILEGAEDVRFGKPALRLSEDTQSAILRLEGERASRSEALLAGEEVTLTLFDGDRGLEERLVLEPGPSLMEGTDGGTFWRLATLGGLALLGGLILNLMPCVLPVLSLKLLSVVSQGGRARQEIRLGFLASAAGIVTSFLVLAAGTIALKASGVAVGWGIQFQEPLFLIFMASVLTLFAGNLFDLFEIGLPGGLANAAASGSEGRHLGGHFLTGAFATLLATPCSAPFLGTAVGFALAAGWAEVLFIFTLLGLGLALPYLLVAVFPSLARNLPRPGRWMITLRRILALALLATAAWLLSVLSISIGGPAALAVAALLVALLALAAFASKLPRGAALVGALGFLGLAIAIPSLWPESGRPAASASAWERFDAARIEGLVEAGEIVFVDVTAEWCITCQANKALVLESDAVLQAFEAAEVVPMVADWTRPDPAISAYLNSFGRYGIPFNVVYGPGAPEGLALPELLTRGAVLEALETAQTQPRREVSQEAWARKPRPLE